LTGGYIARGVSVLKRFKIGYIFNCYFSCITKGLSG
jgi:hypothetical protein